MYPLQYFGEQACALTEPLHADIATRPSDAVVQKYERNDRYNRYLEEWAIHNSTTKRSMNYATAFSGSRIGFWPNPLHHRESEVVTFLNLGTALIRLCIAGALEV